MSAVHDHRHAHQHAVDRDTDRRYLVGALALIAGYMVVELVVGILANSLALISDAGHMLTDAGALALALIAVRLARRPAAGSYTFGWKRAEILSAQLNGLTLLALVGYFGYEGIRRLTDPPDVHGPSVVVTGLIGVAVVLVATWLLSKANRRSLNVEGAFQHVLNDLYATAAMTVSGAVVWLTGFTRADAIAALFIAVLLAKAAWSLLRDSSRVLLEAAPLGIDPAEVGPALMAARSVVEVHDLHIWTVTSGYPALSAHVLVEPGEDCHLIRAELERLLAREYGITHTTLQVDHVPDGCRTRVDGCGTECGSAPVQD